MPVAPSSMQPLSIPYCLCVLSRLCRHSHEHRLRLLVAFTNPLTKSKSCCRAEADLPPPAGCEETMLAAGAGRRGEACVVQRADDVAQAFHALSVHALACYGMPQGQRPHPVLQ
jgi:hypothetical protein